MGTTVTPISDDAIIQVVLQVLASRGVCVAARLGDGQPAIERVSEDGVSPQRFAIAPALSQHFDGMIACQDEIAARLGAGAEMYRVWGYQVGLRVSC